MSNKYNASKTAIIDASGKEWACNVAHPLPLPDGIQPETFLQNPNSAYGAGSPVLFGGYSHWGFNGAQEASDTHWLARAPLPEVPKPKTQEEMDHDAATEFVTKGMDWQTPFSIRDAFKAGAAYARKESK